MSRNNTTQPQKAFGTPKLQYGAVFCGTELVIYW